jgi:putative peptidoglycan lipid II flippase
MIPIAALAAILRLETVAILFGGFDPAAIRLTADTFLAFLLGAPAHALIAVLARAFYARQDTVTPVLAAIGAVIVNTSFAAALVGPYGLPGMAFAIALAAWLEAATLTILLRRREGPLGLAAVGSVATRTLVATGIAGLVGIVAHLVIGSTLAPDPATLGRIGIPGMAAVIVLVSIAFGAVFGASAVALRIAELRSIVGIMVDAIRRPRPA